MSCDSIERELVAYALSKAAEPSGGEEPGCPQAALIRTR